MPAAQGRAFMFTINNYTDEEIQELNDLAQNGLCTYLTYGFEVGPECGTPHLHCYFILKKKKSLGGARKLVPKRAANFEFRKKPHAAAKTYCQKDGNFMEFGSEPNEPGSKRERREEDIDYDAVIDAIKDGVPLKEIVQMFPDVAFKGFSSLKSIYTLFQPLFDFTRFYGPFQNHFPYGWDRSKSLILIGNPGAGKTQWALNEFQNPMLLRNLNGLKAFDKNLFDGVVIDDIDFTNVSRSDMLNLLEVEQPCSLRVLYGIAFLPANVPRIFCLNPGFESLNLDDGAIRRRVNVIRIVNWP